MPAQLIERSYGKRSSSFKNMSGSFTIRDYGARRLRMPIWPGSKTKIGEDGALLVAEIDSSFVGFVAGWIEHSDAVMETWDSNGFGYISDVYVLPEFRGQRIAIRLLSAIEERLCGAGITRIRICALAANASASASYERAGFEPYEIIYEKLAARG
jgi:ribosomal protein S18 acetylase RimI-like enzyme